LVEPTVTTKSSVVLVYAGSVVVEIVPVDATAGDETKPDPKPASLNVTVPVVTVTSVFGVTTRVSTEFTAPGLKSSIVAVNDVIRPMPISPEVPDTAFGANVVDTLAVYEPAVAVLVPPDSVKETVEPAATEAIAVTTRTTVDDDDPEMERVVEPKPDTVAGLEPRVPDGYVNVTSM
jgi:energy-converting hydrogenase Eha subunit E